MSKKKTIVIACLSLAALLGILTAMALKSLNKPATGNVTVGSSGSSLTDVPPAASSITTSYYTTTLPSGFAVTSQNETPAGSLRLANAVATGGKRKQVVVAITVGRLPADGLGGISDYNLRATQTATYARTALPGQPANAQSFKSIASPNNLCVFWTTDTKYYEVAITSEGGDSYESLLPTYGQIAATWQTK